MYIQLALLLSECSKGCNFCEYDSEIGGSICHFGQCKEGYVMLQDRTCKGTVIIVVGVL